MSVIELCALAGLWDVLIVSPSPLSVVNMVRSQRQPPAAGYLLKDGSACLAVNDGTEACFGGD